MEKEPISIIGVSVQENRQVQMSCAFQKRLNIKANTNSAIAAPVNIMIYIRANKEYIKNLLNKEHSTFIQIYKVRTDPAFSKIPHSSVSKK